MALICSAISAMSILALCCWWEKNKASWVHGHFAASVHPVGHGAETPAVLVERMANGNTMNAMSLPIGAGLGHASSSIFVMLRSGILAG